MMSFHDCSFYFVMKGHGQFLFYKMAERGSQDICSSRGMGRARVLVEAMEDFRREGGQRSPSPPPMVQRVRVGPKDDKMNS